MSFCQNGGKIHIKRSDSNERLLLILTLDFLGSCSIITLHKSTGKVMISKILNGIILFFVLGIGIFYVIGQFTSTDTVVVVFVVTEQPDIVDYTPCKNLVERPPQVYMGFDIGQGYDCLD